MTKAYRRAIKRNESACFSRCVCLSIRSASTGSFNSFIDLSRRSQISSPRPRSRSMTIWQFRSHNSIAERVGQRSQPSLRSGSLASDSCALCIAIRICIDKCEGSSVRDRNQAKALLFSDRACHESWLTSHRRASDCTRTVATILTIEHGEVEISAHSPFCASRPRRALHSPVLVSLASGVLRPRARCFARSQADAGRRVRRRDEGRRMRTWMGQIAPRRNKIGTR